MKLSLSSFFILLFATAVVTSCEQCGNVTIMEPTAADVAWLVYRQKDSIRFETELNENVTYARSGIFAQNIPGEGFSPDDECIENINVQVRTLIEDVKDKQPPLGTRILTKPDDLIVEVSVADQGVWEINEQEPTFASIEVNGKSYSNVYEIKPNSTAANSVKRILYNQQFGFLSLEFNNGKKLELKPQ